MTPADTLRDEVVMAMGWTSIHSERHGDHYNLYGVPPGGGNDCTPIDIPALTDERALGWAVARIREAGWQWTNGFQPGHWHAAKRAWIDGVSVNATGNDAEDAMRLLLAVLKAKGGMT